MSDTPANEIETPETFDLAMKHWGKWPKPGEIEAFDLARSLERRLQEALARIDALMLEYCPDEMTPEQVNEWGKHAAALFAAKE